MARTARTRYRTTTFDGSYDSWVNGVYSGNWPSTFSRESSITDWHGRPVADGSLNSIQYYGPGLSLSGTAETKDHVDRRTFKKFPIPLGLTNLIGALPAPNGWMLDMVAGTSPSRPTFTPATMAQDLLQLPGQIKELGKLITKPKSLMSAKELANHYLCAQFGWRPLIKDLQDLMHVHERIAKKCKELNDLYKSPTGIRKRLRFGESNENSEGVYRHSFRGINNYLDCSYDIQVMKQSWGTMRWYPTSPPPYNPTDSDQAAFARKIIFGLTVEGMAKGAWDVIPWTWLIGWFTNIGKYTHAYSNTVPAKHGTGSFMSHARALAIPKVVTYNGMSRSDVKIQGLYMVEAKTRVVSGVAVAGFNLPFMDGFKASILGALFVQRTMR